ncbi:hypothetical protein J3E72DRAFT_393437 [Bipolaris maydis]|nr:hypothetical protein J3E72DRAFT_393437 [Bipolaris maydis]
MDFCLAVTIQLVILGTQGFSSPTASSLASSTYSDFKITCGSDTYKVRKVIVYNRAEFFARAVSFSGQSGILDLPEDEPETVKLLIQYLYERGYEPQLPLTDTLFSIVAISTPVEHGKSSSKKLDYHLVFPHTYYNEHNYCHNINTSDFHIAVNYTFSTTPEGDSGLRDLINQSIAKHIELAQGAAIRKLLTQFNSLALGILNAKSEELGWNTKS